MSFTIFAKPSILDVWEGSEYVSKLASSVKNECFIFKSISLSKVTANRLLGKTNKKEPTKLQNSWTKMLLNRTNS